MTNKTEVAEDSASEPAESERSDGETGDSSRGLVPDPEEAEDRWFQELPRQLDDEDVEAEYEGDEEVVEDAETRLVEQLESTFRFYVYRRIDPRIVVAVGLWPLLNRFIQPAPIKAYGLVANLVGTIILGVNTTQERYVIEQLSLPEQDQTVLRESYARQTAATIQD